MHARTYGKGRRFLQAASECADKNSVFEIEAVAEKLKITVGEAKDCVAALAHFGLCDRAYAQRRETGADGKIRQVDASQLTVMGRQQIRQATEDKKLSRRAIATHFLA
jgi:hypothetical protein